MVAKVISGKNIRGVLNYNENKVGQGTAVCIMAHHFGCEAYELTFTNKLRRFQKLTQLNPKAKTNALHISLNFDVSETLDKEKLSRIATTYMDKIGFGQQPYLVYQHHDAAHPHIHIITTTVQPTGHRIDIHNIGRNQSEKARKEIEKTFELVRAESKGKKQQFIQPIEIDRVKYGKSQTKRSISNVVRMVARSYKYTSLPEFNAVLSQFNITADRGKEGTTMHTKKGLLYSVLDKDGKKIGVPIKASTIYGKPTLTFLEKQFKLNEALRTPHKEHIRKCIDNAVASNLRNRREHFVKSLNRQHIFVLFRENADGLIYGITFVDNKTKVVFNGSNLGKAYGAKAILSKLVGQENHPTGKMVQQFALESDTPDLGIDKALDQILTAQQHGSDYINPNLRRRKRKKRRRSI